MYEITVEDISKPNQVAQAVVAFHEASEQKKLSLVQRWNEVRNYIYATDTSSTTAQEGSPWKNRTTRPKLTWIHDKLLTEYVRNLLPSDNFFRWQAHPRSGSDKAKAIEHYMIHKLRHPLVNFRHVLTQCLDDFIMFGNAFAGVEYVVHRQRSIKTGEQTLIFKGARPYRISPYDSHLDPDAANFERSYFASRAVKPMAQFLRDVHANPSMYVQSEVEKVKAARANSFAEGVIDFIKKQNQANDSLVVPIDMWESQEVELIEYYGDIYDKDEDKFHENVHVVVADGLWPIVFRSNPTYTGAKPVVHAGWRRRPENLWGMGPLENLVGLQYRIDHMENAKSDAIDYCVYPIIKVTGDATDDDYLLQPGEKWYVPSNGNVELIYPDPRVLMFENPIMAYEREMEEYAGVPRETAGFRTPGEKTAFEVDQLLSHADNHFAEKLLQFEDEFIEPMLNLLLEMNFMLMDRTDLASIPEGDYEGWAKLTPDDLKQDGRLYPIGSKHFRHRQTKMEKVVQILEVGAKLAQQHTDSYQALKVLEEESGLEEYGIIRFGAGMEESVQLAKKQQELEEQQNQAGKL